MTEGRRGRPRQPGPDRAGPAGGGRPASPGGRGAAARGRAAAARRARAAILAAILAAQAALTGCWGIAPMDQRGLVMELGIDAGAAGGYQVTAAIVNPLGQPTVQGMNAGATPELVRTAAGPTVSAAVGELSATSYLDLDFRHLSGVIVSEAVARQGLAPTLEVMVRSDEFDTTPWLYVARGGNASQLLRRSVRVMPNAAATLQGTTIWSHATVPAYTERVYAFLERMRLTGDDPATAGVRLDAAQQSQPDTLAWRLSGIALFRGDRLVGWLEGPAGLGWLVATGRAQRQGFGAPGPDGGTVSLNLIADSRRIRVTPSPAGPRAQIRVRVRAELASVPPGEADFWQNTSAVQAIEDHAAGVLAADIESALGTARRDGADVFGLGQYVRIADPADWSRLAPVWDTTGFPSLPVAIQVQVAVTTVGRLVCPIFGPC